MKKNNILLQILTSKNIITREQKVISESEQFYKKLLETVGVANGKVIIQVQVDGSSDNAVNDMELRLSPLTQNYEWHEKVSPVDLYNSLPPRMKKVLLILADYSNEEAAELTGRTEGYLNKLRSQIYERIDIEGRRKHHHKNDLKAFCSALMAAGVELIVWTREMKAIS